jgi:hypothetical protein
VVSKDNKGFFDSKSIPITLIEKDETPPYLLKDKITIEKIQKSPTIQSGSVGSGDEIEISYKVTLLFSDAESTLKQGSLWQ